MNNERELLPEMFEILKNLKKKVDNFREPKKYYRNKNLKDLFGLSDNTIISYRDNNTIPFTKIGEIYYYPIDEIDKLLQKNSNYDLFKNKPIE